MFKSLLFKVIFSVAISIFIIELIIGLFSVSSRKKQLILSKTESFQLTTEALEDDILDFYPKEQEKILIRLQHLSQNLGLTCIQLYSDTQKTLLSTCPTVDTKFYPSGFSDNIMISKDEDLIRYKINLKQNNSLSLIYDFPNAQFIKETKKYALNIVALVGIIIAFVTLIMSFILYLIILKPIISIKQQIAHSLDQGHIDLTTKIQNHSKDELGEITNFFNLYIEKVHSFIVHAIETYRELKERIQSLHKLTNKIHEGSEKVLESTKKITGDAESQNKELGSIQQSIKNMENEISSLYEIADDSGEHAKKTLQTIAIAQKQGQNSLLISEKLEKNLNSINAKMQNLEKQSNEIGKVVDIISKIAKQINLLALNAAIEAERAGESGKGFGVVSSEISKLADTSSSSTQNINTFIRDIQSSIQEVLSAISLISKDSKLHRDNIQQLSENFMTVEQSAREMEVYTGSIHNYIKQQKELAGIINLSIQHLYALSKNYSDETKEASFETAMQKKDSEEITKTLHEILNSSNNLKNLIEKFIV